MNNKNVHIIAGPNGAGKTTFAIKFLPEYARCPNFINADLIAHGLSCFTPGAAAINAGKLVLEQIHEFAQWLISLLRQRFLVNCISTCSNPLRKRGTKSTFIDCRKET